MYYTLFRYKYIFSPLKQQVEMHLKEENLTENHTTPMVPEIHLKHQPMNQTKVRLWMEKTKVETSSLKNL